MPRPRQYYSRSGSGPWKETYVVDGAIDRTSSGWGSSSHDSLDRPASVSVPKDANGWRRPRAYRVTRKMTRTHLAGYSEHEYRPGLLAATTVIQRQGVPSWGFGAPEPSFPLWIRNQAEVKALVKLKDQKVDFSTMLAEYRSTANQFVDTTTRLAGAIRAARRGDAADALKSLGVLKGQRKAHKAWDKKSPANRWLELQYGVMPLVNDVVGSAESLAKNALNPLAGLVTVRASASNTETSEEVLGRAYSGAFEVRRRSVVQQSALCRLMYLPDPKFSAYLATWGLSNPAATGFNLLPLSFVLDWFLPVGRWLQALDADNGYTFKGGSVTLHTLVNRDDYEVPSSSLDANFRYRKGRSSSMRRMHHYKDVNRQVYATSPSPWYPSWREATAPSGKQIVSGLALLAQAFLK